MKHKAAIALGSNLGDREANLREALRRLSGLDAPSALGEVKAVSGFYDTEPVGYLDQPRFLNAAVIMETPLSPLDLLAGMQAIEHEMGRERLIPKGPRVIDLDLLLYEDRVMSTSELTLPHPEMHARRFVLEPLSEIAPDWRHPALHRNISELLRDL